MERQQFVYWTPSNGCHVRQVKSSCISSQLIIGAEVVDHMYQVRPWIFLTKTHTRTRAHTRAHTHPHTHTHTHSYTNTKTPQKYIHIQSKHTYAYTTHTHTHTDFELWCQKPAQKVTGSKSNHWIRLKSKSQIHHRNTPNVGVITQKTIDSNELVQ